MRSLRAGRIVLGRQFSTLPPSSTPPPASIGPDFGVTTSGFNDLTPGLTNVDAVLRKGGGFKVNGIRMLGPVFLLKDVALQWKAPPRASELTIDCFSLLKLVWPTPSLVIIGTGASILPLSSVLVKELRKIAPVEILGALNSFKSQSREEPLATPKRERESTYASDFVHIQIQRMQQPLLTCLTKRIATWQELCCQS